MIGISRIQFDLPLERDPSRLPSLFSLDREQSLAVLDLLLSYRKDGEPPTPV